MSSHNLSNMPEQLKLLLACLGGMLAFCGGLLLLIFAYLVYQSAFHPQDVAVVQFLLDKAEFKAPVMDGKMILPGDDPREDPSFVLNFSSYLKTIIMIFLGIAALGVLINLINVLISSGVKIIQACYGGLK